MADRTAVFGIDPGVSGGMACLHVEGGRVVRVLAGDIPHVKLTRGTVRVKGKTRPRNVSQPNAPKIAKAIQDAAGDLPSVAVVEQTWPRPTDGKWVVESITASRWLFVGIFAGLGLDVLTVSPTSWQSSLLTNGDGGAIRSDCKDRRERRRQIKASSIAWVVGTYGTRVPLIPDGCRTPSDGRADAVCVAHFGAVKLGLIGA